MGLTAAVSSGDRVEALTALRDTLAESIEAADPGQVAALARQLSLVLAELAELNPNTEGDIVDDLAARRVERLSGTDAARGAAAKRKRGG